MRYTGAILCLLMGLASALPAQSVKATPARGNAMAANPTGLARLASPTMVQMFNDARWLRPDDSMVHPMGPGDDMAYLLKGLAKGGDEFDQKRSASETQKKYEAYLEKVAACKKQFSKFTFRGLTLGAYSFEDGGFRFPTFPAAVRLGSIQLWGYPSDPGGTCQWPLLVQVDRGPAEAFVKACPGRRVDITFVMESVDRHFEPLFYIVEYVDSSRGKPETRVLSVMNNSNHLSNKIISYAARMARNDEVLDRPADLKDSKDVMSNSIDGVSSSTMEDNYSMLDRAFEHSKRLKLALSSEAESARLKIMNRRNTRTQLMIGALTQKRWYSGAWSGMGGKFPFSVLPVNFDPKTGRLQFKYFCAAYKTEFDMDGMLKFDNLGPFLELNFVVEFNQRSKFEFRLRGTSQFCGVKAGSSQEAYFLLDGDGERLGPRTAAPAGSRLGPATGNGLLKPGEKTGLAGGGNPAKPLKGYRGLNGSVLFVWELGETDGQDFGNDTRALRAFWIVEPDGNESRPVFKVADPSRAQPILANRQQRYLVKLIKRSVNPGKGNDRVGERIFERWSDGRLLVKLSYEVVSVQDGIHFSGTMTLNMDRDTEWFNIKGSELKE